MGIMKMLLWSALVAFATSQAPTWEVVTLIRELKAEFEAKGKEEEEIYNKFSGWCDETQEKKKKDIESAEDRVHELNALIEENSGKKGSYGAEIENLKKNI